MSGVLLDTNVLSEVVRRDPSSSVMARLRAVAAADLYTSSICVMELRSGAVRRGGEALWARIRRAALARVQILAIGEEEALVAGDILASLIARGQPIGIEDVLIGATALARGLSVATRNVKHLARVDGLVVEDWFSDQ
jgi:predicted nucleic acid-binding protein